MGGNFWFSWDLLIYEKLLYEVQLHVLMWVAIVALAEFGAS